MDPNFIIISIGNLFFKFLWHKRDGFSKLKETFLCIYNGVVCIFVANLVNIFRVVFLQRCTHFAQGTPNRISPLKYKFRFFFTMTILYTIPPPPSGLTTMCFRSCQLPHVSDRTLQDGWQRSVAGYSDSLTRTTTEM